jgi:hypothetical protein
MHVPTALRGPLGPNEVLPARTADEAELADFPVAGTAQIVELILKDRAALHRLLFATRHKIELATRLLAISLASFALFGVAMALTCDAASVWPHLTPTAKWLANRSADVVTYSPTTGSSRFVRSWISGRAERMVIAYAFGLIAASGVCLPSLYFYGLLSGLRMSVGEVVLHTLKAKGVSAVALVGILPIYAALVLGAVVFPLAPEVVRATLLVGLCLPFLAGLWGTRSLYVGFAKRCDIMPEEFQKNRACFLRRLVFAWCACYTAVAPVMIATVWQNLGG